MPETIRKFSRFIDGYYGTPVRTSRTPREYPFRMNGDTTTAVYTATYVVDQGKFTPTAIGTVDPENAGFYLMAETVPEIVDGDLATFRRTYSNVPGTQTTYSTMVLNKPNPEAVVGASAIPLVWNGDPNLDTFVDGGNVTYFNSGAFTRAREVFKERGVGAKSSTAGSGGTLTVTYEGSTTAAFAYNESDANITAAVNALASVIAEGLVFSAVNTLGVGGGAGGYLKLIATTGTPLHRFTAANSLTPSGAGTFIVQKFNEFEQYIWIAGRITLTAHGFDDTLSLYTRRTGSSPAAVVFRPGQWAVVDANTLAVQLHSGTALTDIAYAGQQIRNYTPGTARVRIKQVQAFYLPGVTSGITTVDDIPIPQANAGDTNLLTLAADDSISGFQIYDATRLAPWRDSAILEQTVTYINVDNL